MKCYEFASENVKLRAPAMMTKRQLTRFPIQFDFGKGEVWESRGEDEDPPKKYQLKNGN